LNLDTLILHVYALSVVTGETGGANPRGKSMVTTLSKLVEMMERGAIPAWIRDAVTAKREEIVKELHEKGVYTLEGPNGENVNIRASKTAVAA
jgi:hypothetical protein